MPAKLNPYITFAGNAREAMEFYQAALGGELAVNTFGEFGEEGPNGDKIMHARLETPDGFTLMSSDTLPGMDAPSGSSITVSLSGDDADKLRAYWEKLTQGVGRRVWPVHRQVRDPVDGEHHRSSTGMNRPVAVGPVCTGITAPSRRGAADG